MKERNLIRWIGLAGLSLMIGTSGLSAARPNVLLIMSDTQRYDDLRCAGNPVIRTPHLDQLAQEGVRFEHCYTQSPACMPARATIFTGRYPAAHGVWSNGVPLPESEITLASWLARHGYHTFGAGKFHFIPHYPYRSPLPTMATHPQPYYGFQEFHLGEDGRSGEHWQWLRDHHPEYLNKPDHELPLELHNTFWAANLTIEFLKQRARDGQPFFAFCSFVDPHQSYDPPSPYREMYREDEVPPPVRRPGELAHSRFKKTAERPPMARYNERVARHRTQHYGKVTFIDDAVGRLVEALDSLGLRERTLIVFLSDHGDMLGDHWLWWKGAYHYRACANVPLIFNWPGHIRAGKVVSGIVQQTDTFPTITALLGLDHPLGVQGRSLEPLLTSEATDTGYEFAYIESVSSGAYSPKFIGPKGGKPISPVDTLTLRSHQWRFTVYTGTEQGELYDLRKDPDEFVNLWDEPQYQPVKHRLTAKLLERLQGTRDPLPVRTRPY